MSLVRWNNGVDAPRSARRTGRVQPVKESKEDENLLVGTGQRSWEKAERTGEDWGVKGARKREKRER